MRFDIIDLSLPICLIVLFSLGCGSTQDDVIQLNSPDPSGELSPPTGASEPMSRRHNDSDSIAATAQEPGLPDSGLDVNRLQRIYFAQGHDGATARDYYCRIYSIGLLAAK